MVKSKKLLSIVLSVVLIVSTFAFSASALTYSPSTTSGALVITASADKTTVNPGDTVKISLSIQSSTYSDFGAAGWVISYPKELIAPTTTVNTTFRKWVNSCAGWTNQTSTVNFNCPTTKFASYYTTEEAAYYTGHLLMLGIVDSANGALNQVGSGWNPAAEGETFVEMSFTVASDAAAGSEIWVGLHDATAKGVMSYVYSPCKSTKLGAANMNLTNSMVKLTVASATPSYAVTKASGQVKFTGDKATSTPDDAFKFRLVSSMTDADFTAMNSGSNSIKKLGFIAANTGATGADAAKAQVEAGSAVTGDWSEASTTYIKHDTGTVATFGSIITGLKHSIQTTDIDCYAYVCYNDGTTDHYVWYSAVYTAPVSTGYSNAVTNWAKS